MNPNDTPTRCPHCGADKRYERADYTRFECGYESGCVGRPELCREREARQKLEAELSMWRDGGIMYEEHRDELEKLEAEVAFWKAKAYEAEASEGKLEAEVERLKYTLEEARAARNHAALREQKKFLPLLREKEAEVARLAEQVTHLQAVIRSEWPDDQAEEIISASLSGTLPERSSGSGGSSSLSG